MHFFWLLWWFGLSFWRQPFTPEDRFVSKWFDFSKLVLIKETLVLGTVNSKQIHNFGWTVPLSRHHSDIEMCGFVPTHFWGYQIGPIFAGRNHDGTLNGWRTSFSILPSDSFLRFPKQRVSLICMFFHYGFKEHHSSFEQALSLDIYVHFKILLLQPPTI